ncbi:MAG: hypothetical protein HZB13_09035 [Acidobacteria bacterium]|nr:hypothetical protein [Acidobacteriota bacterium]
MTEARQGQVWAAMTEEDLRLALEQAFDYRGDVTLTLKDGSRIEGYIFDRRSAPTLAESKVRIIPGGGRERLAIAYSDIGGLEFTGRDTAAGKSWEAWVKKYVEKKAAGETGIELKPEDLD